ncbi:Fatty acid metabolism regulator protein [Rhodococcus ruber]|uniref:TetR/AcrR family transcriptional regulator n=1 Tax=Rhodococcus ruber TaxID=1830 RepID=UPI00315CA748
MASTRERGRRDSARRQQILDTALELFATRAYEDVSVDDVCDRAGVAHGLISYYFGGKRGLFAEAVRQAWNELLEYERPREDEQDASERIHGFVRRHFEYVAEHPHRFTTLMRTGHADREVYDIVIGARGEALAELQLSLGCPVNPPAQLRAALRGWMGYLDNMTLDWAFHRDLDLDVVTDMCVQALIGAVRATAGHRYDPDVELATLSRVAAIPTLGTSAALPRT